MNLKCVAWCIFIHSASLCLSLAVLRVFTFNVVVAMLEFKSDILLFFFLFFFF